MSMLRVLCCAAALLAIPSIGIEAQSFPLASHFVQPVMSFSADGRYLALGGSVGPALDNCPLPTCSGRVHLWDLRAGTRVFASDASTARVMSLAMTRDGRQVVSGHVDGTVRVWSADGGVVHQLLCCNGSWIRSLAVSPDDRVLAAGAQNGEIVLWSLDADLSRPGSARVLRTLTGHYFGVSSVVFEASGKYLLSSADDQHVRRWDITTGHNYEFSRTPQLRKAHRGMVKSVVPLADGRRAVSGSYWEGGTYKAYDSVAPPDHILRLWDIDSGRPIRSYPLKFGVRCCIQVVPGTSSVAFLKAMAWDELPRLHVVDLDTGAVVNDVGPTMGESFHALAMHPNGSTFLIAIGDGDFLIWSRTMGRMTGRLISADEGWAVIAADGRMDFSEGFRRWPCAHGIMTGCAGGSPATASGRLLPSLIGQ